MKTSMSLGRVICEFRRLFRQPTYCMLKRYMSAEDTSMVDPDQSDGDGVNQKKTKAPVAKIRKAKPTRSRKKAEVTEPVSEKKSTITTCANDEILDFFNNCDPVTLRKLKKIATFPQMIGLKKDFSACFSRDPYGDKLTFADMESFCKKTEVESSQLPDMHFLINELRKSEQNTFGLPGLRPSFSLENIEAVKYVVAVEVFVNNFSWAVMTPERVLLDAGEKKLSDKKDYNHKAHFEMVPKVLEAVPPSFLYVMSSRIQIKNLSTQRYRPYQVLMEALLKTYLNYRMNRIYTKADANTMDNFVYHFKDRDLHLFHDIFVNNEMVPLKPLYMKWLRQDKGPLRGMVWKDSRKAVTEGICKCIFIADVTARCLAKKDSAFPSAYFNARHLGGMGD